MKVIEVKVDPAQAPDYLKSHLDLYYGNELRKAGIPLVERTLSEGPNRGSLHRQVLESGSVLFRWTDEVRTFPISA